MRPGSYYRAQVIGRLGIEPPEGWVLDMGAGDGQALAHLGPAKTVALDPAPPPRITGRLVRGDGRRAPFASASFEMVLALDVLEHVEDPAALVAEIERLALPGATVWVSVPSAGLSIFPGFLTPAAHRAWGHLRPGYSRAEIAGLFPVAHVHTWNEPAYRMLYVPVRVLAAVCPPLARWLIRRAAAFDSRHRDGDRGHFFLSSTRPVEIESGS